MDLSNQPKGSYFLEIATGKGVVKKKLILQEDSIMNRAFLLSAVVFTFFLCYIDEGYYDLRWMKDWSNWIAFTLYVVVLFLAQKGIHYLLKPLFNSSKTVLSVVLGWVLG